MEWASTIHLYTSTILTYLPIILVHLQRELSLCASFCPSDLCWALHFLYLCVFWIHRCLEREDNMRSCEAIPSRNKWIAPNIKMMTSLLPGWMLPASKKIIKVTSESIDPKCSSFSAKQNWHYNFFQVNVRSKYSPARCPGPQSNIVLIVFDEGSFFINSKFASRRYNQTSYTRPLHNKDAYTSIVGRW
jgi:hypothetical protein